MYLQICISLVPLMPLSFLLKSPLKEFVCFLHWWCNFFVIYWLNLFYIFFDWLSTFGIVHVCFNFDTPHAVSVFIFAQEYVSPPFALCSKRVFILGPSHHFYMKKCALSQNKTYQTPLYDLTIDQESEWLQSCWSLCCLLCLDGHTYQCILQTHMARLSTQMSWKLQERNSCQI